MRRIHSLLLVSALAVAAVACAGGNNASNAPSLILPSGLQQSAEPTHSAKASEKASAGASSAVSSAEASFATSSGGASLAPESGSPSASLSGPSITVTAVDYQFTGMPTSVPVGTTLTLQNSGTEVHEMVVVRKNDDTTQSWDELLQMPQEEVGQYVTIVGGAVAAPGTTSDVSVQVTQEGDYLMICFVSQGTYSLPPTMPAEPSEAASSGATSSGLESPAASLGLPHFMLGMEQEFQVTAAGSTPGPIPSPMASAGASAGSSAESSGMPMMSAPAIESISPY